MPRTLTPDRVPVTYWVFLGVSLWTSLGTQVLAFGSPGTPPESARPSPAAASPPLSLPAWSFLPFFSGALADRYGPARVVSLSAAGTVVVAAATAVLAPWILRNPDLLLAVSLLLGTASAFTIPAIGVIPRLLVPASLLPRAVALGTMGQQLITLVGPATGGLVVHQFGLRGSALAETVGATAMLVIAIRFRNVTVVVTAEDGSLKERLLGGLRVVAGSRVLLLLVLSLVFHSTMALRTRPRAPSWSSWPSR